MEQQPNQTLLEAIFWIQILITNIFGIVTVYLLDILPSIFLSHRYSSSLPVFLNIFLIYILILITIPAIILRLKSKASLKFCLTSPFKGFGTQMVIYILFCGITFMVGH